MGDCGAFAYVSEEVPPVTVEEVVEFYNECDFDMGVSVDHVIPGYQPNNAKGIPEWVKNGTSIFYLIEENHEQVPRLFLVFLAIPEFLWRYWVGNL